MQQKHFSFLYIDLFTPQKNSQIEFESRRRFSAFTIN